MFCGLDFGTSNSLIAHYSQNSVQPIPIDGDDIMLPSVLLALKREPVVAPINEKLFEREVAREMQGKPKHHENDIRRIIRAKFKQDAYARAMATYESEGLNTISDRSVFLYGSEAIETNTLYPEDGIFAKSPKTFLGSDLPLYMLSNFELLVRKLLTHIKTSAETRTRQRFDSVVIGKPVNYGAIASRTGNNQALNIMTRAANSAGFKHIEFEFEPVAAALDFERGLQSEKRVLIIDIGGGTTDVTMMLLSADRALKADRKQDILGAAGSRVGGNDIDIFFALSKLCAHLGKLSVDENRKLINKDCPLDNGIYVDACSINDVNALKRFAGCKEAIVRGLQKARNSQMRSMLTRLQVLQKDSLIYTFNRSAEEAKIGLSNQVSMTLDLEYLEDGFSARLNQQDLIDVMSGKTATIKKLIATVVQEAGVQPDVIYFTGGSAKSPVLVDLLISPEDKAKVVSGDHYGGVVKGLTVVAGRRFR